MALPLVFTSFDEWADAAGLTPEERAEQDRWGATVGERFDTDDMHRQWAERFSPSGSFRPPWRDVPDGEGGGTVLGLLEHLEQKVHDLRVASEAKRTGKRRNRRSAR